MTVFHHVLHDIIKHWEIYFKGFLKVDEKSPGNFITVVDKKSTTQIKYLLQKYFPKIHIYGPEEMELLGNDLPSGEWIGFDPLDGATSYARGRKDWGASIFRMKDGNIIEAHALTANPDPRGYSRRRLFHLPFVSFRAKRSSCLNYALSIPWNSSTLDHCKKYQDFLYSRGLVTGEHSYGSTISNMEAFFDGQLDACIHPGSSDILKLAAAHHLVEKNSGLVLNEFGEKLIWTQRWQNVIFAKDYKTASRFYMPRP